MNKYFVFTGNAYPHKNLERLVQAIVVLNKKQKEKVILKIAGSRSIFTDRLVDLIDRNNAAQFIQILGFVSDEELKKIYKNSVAFVFPTLSEGFGLPPMEAIKAGAVVAASDIPVIREVYGDSVYYFDPLNIHSIAESLKSILVMSSKEKEKKMNFAQNYIKKYSWKKMAEETLRIYEECVK